MGGGDDDSGGGLFYNLGHCVARHPVVVIGAGLVSTLALSTGLLDPAFETDINDLWIEEGGRVDIERRYTDMNSIDGTRSTTELWTTISKPLDNVLNRNTLGEHLRLAQELDSMTVRHTVDGVEHEFDVRDLCSGSAEYVLQCTRVTALDCYFEGSFDLPTRPDTDAGVQQMATNVALDPVALATIDAQVEALRTSLCPATQYQGPIGELCALLDGLTPYGGPYTVLTLPAIELQVGVIAGMISQGLIFQGDLDASGNPNPRGGAYYFRPSFSAPEGDPAYTSDAGIEAAGSGQCMFWDNGEILPSIPQDIVLGKETRTSTEFVALEFVYYIIEAEAVVERVKSPWRGGGPIPNLSVDDANSILDQWRVQMTQTVDAATNEMAQNNAFSSDSFDLILEEFSSANLPLIGAGYLLLIVYAFFSLRRSSTKCNKILVQSKSMVGACGVVAVALGVSGGLGLACYAGVPLNATSTQVLPFLLLGLGVDDMFVIAHNLDEDLSTPVEMLIGQLMAVVGPSITLTSVTNAAAFAIGRLTPLPVVIDFASQASISIVLLYFVNLLVFPAMLTLNERRIRAKRVDCLPCLTLEDFEQEQRSGHEGFMKDRVLNGAYIPFLKKTTGKVAVLTSFAGLLAIGVWGSLTQVELGLSIADVAPKGTQEYEFLDIRYSYFSFYDMQIVTQEFDYWTYEAQQNMISMFERVSDTSHVVDDGATWYHAFISWALPDQNEQESYLYFLCTLGLVGGAAGIPPAACTDQQTFAGFQLGLEYQVCQGAMAAVPSCADVVNPNAASYCDFTCFATGAYLNNPLQQGCIEGTCFGAPNTAPVDLSNGEMTAEEYQVVVNVLVSQSAALNLQNSACDSANALTNGNCGAKQVLSNGIPGGCTAILTPQVEGVDVDFQGGDNPAALCVQDIGGQGTGNVCFNMPANEDTFYECLNLFKQKSTAAALTSPYWFPEDTESGEVGPLTFSEFSMYSFDLVDNQDFVDLIEDVRAELALSNDVVPAYPKGTAFIYWEQYLGLQETLLRNVIYALITVFCTTFLLLVAVPKLEREKMFTLVCAGFGGAAILVFVLATYMVELYGFMGIAGIKLSALPAVSLIMAVGVGVEFTAHIILAFLIAEGTREERMEAALDHMFMPTIDGTISTILGIIMLAFSDFEFIFKYYFLVYLFIVVLGCVNGLVLLPTLLSIVGPPSVTLAPQGGTHVTVRRGSLRSESNKHHHNPAFEMPSKSPGHDFV